MMESNEVSQEHLPINEIVDKAKFTLEKTGRHLPMWILCKDKNAQIIITDWGNDKEKKFLVDRMRAYVNDFKPDFYYHISEVWMKTFTGGDRMPPDKRPKDYEDKTEALIVSRFQRDNRNQMRIIEFKKESDKIVFLKETDTKGTEVVSIMNFYLEDAHNERIDKELERWNDERKKDKSN